MKKIYLLFVLIIILFAGYGLYNQKNNNEVPNPISKYEQISEQENKIKGIETILLLRELVCNQFLMFPKQIKIIKTLSVLKT